MGSNSRTALLSPVPESSLPPRISRVKKFACAAVLVCETCERLAFYSLLGTLIPYLQTQVDIKGQSHPHQGLNWYPAVTVSFMFQAFAFVLSVFAGWFTDRYFGKFRALVIFFTFYICGYSIWLYASFCQSDSGRIICPAQNEKTNVTKLDSENYFDNLTTYNKVLMPIALFLVALGVGGVKASIAPFGADQVWHNKTRTFLYIAFQTYL